MVITKPRSITFLAVIIVGIIVLVVLLSAQGLFDPLSDGELIWWAKLNAMHVPPDSTKVRWLNNELPPSPLGIRLTAAYGDGEIDSGYGLIFGHDEGTISIMISPLGYAAVSRQANGAESDIANFLLPWQTWPHVRIGDEINELYAYLDSDTMTVSVNREWFWEGDGIEGIRKVGIVGESFGKEVTIDFQFAEISAVESSK